MEMLAGFFAGLDGATTTALVVGIIAVVEALKAQDGLDQLDEKVERERRQDTERRSAEAGNGPLGPGPRCGD